MESRCIWPSSLRSVLLGARRGGEQGAQARQGQRWGDGGLGCTQPNEPPPSPSPPGLSEEPGQSWGGGGVPSGGRGSPVIQSFPPEWQHNLMAVLTCSLVPWNQEG